MYIKKTVYTKNEQNCIKKNLQKLTGTKNAHTHTQRATVQKHPRDGARLTLPLGFIFVLIHFLLGRLG